MLSINRVANHSQSMVAPPVASSFSSNQEPLTAIESAILEQIAKGATDKEVACRFLIYERAVRKHLGRVFDKLGVQNRGEAVAWARGKNMPLTAPEPLGETHGRISAASPAPLVVRPDFWASLEREIATSKQKAQSLSIMLVEIEVTAAMDPSDHGRRDAIAADVQRILLQVSPQDASLTQYGQNRCVVILPETPKRNAFLIGEQVFQRLQELRFEGFHLAVSLGVSTSPEDGMTPENLLHEADQAIRHSKRSGGNRISIFRARQ